MIDMRNKRYMLVLGIILSTIFLLSACSNVNGQSGVSGKAPGFVLDAIDGSSIDLSRVLQTKNAVLVFWATWCPSCVGEIPHVEKYYSENGGTVAVIGINIRESKDKVASFVKKKGISYPVALDTGGEIAAAYGVQSIPTVVAVSRNGDILYYGHDIVQMSRTVDLKNIDKR